jgi:hypothetical protein
VGVGEVGEGADFCGRVKGTVLGGLGEGEGAGFGKVDAVAAGEGGGDGGGRELGGGAGQGGRASPCSSLQASPLCGRSLQSSPCRAIPRSLSA